MKQSYYIASSRLMKLLTTRLGCQKTPAKSLVILHSLPFLAGLLLRPAR